MVNCVERFRQVNGGDDGAERGFLFVEAGGDSVSKREESGDTGVVWSEAMLRRVLLLLQPRAASGATLQSCRPNGSQHTPPSNAYSPSPSKIRSFFTLGARTSTRGMLRAPFIARQSSLAF